MRIFLTGGTGFIGRNLAVKLDRMGYHVRCLVRDREKAHWMREHPGLQPVLGDLLDRKKLIPLVRDADVIFHLAGLTKARNRDEYMRVNGRGTETLMDAVSTGGIGVKKVVYVSSLAVAGPHTAQDPATENGPVAPVTYYGESKLLGEQLLQEKLKDIAWTIIRPPVVYGPFDRDVYLYFKFAGKGFVPVLGKGDMSLSIIHVHDVTEGIILAGFTDESNGEILYLSDGKVYTVKGALTVLTAVVGGGKLVHLPPLVGRAAGYIGDVFTIFSGRTQVINSQKIKEALQGGWVCRNDKISDLLGFSPTVHLEEGFSSTYRWYKTAGWL